MWQSSKGGWILIILGIVFLLENVGIISWSMLGYWWPVILIAVGVGMMYHKE
jgi:predicted membrane protein